MVTVVTPFPRPVVADDRRCPTDLITPSRPRPIPSRLWLESLSRYQKSSCKYLTQTALLEEQLLIFKSIESEGKMGWKWTGMELAARASGAERVRLSAVRVEPPRRQPSSILHRHARPP